MTVPPLEPGRVGRLIICRGLPGSGKSTHARAWVAQDRARRARVNRDDLRAMVDDGQFFEGVTEPRITAIERAAVRQLLGDGVDVIVDDTNLPHDVVREWINLATAQRAQWEIRDFTGVDLEECVRRNAARAGRACVPEHVIRDMHARHIAPYLPPGWRNAPMPDIRPPREEDADRRERQPEVKDERTRPGDEPGYQPTGIPTATVQTKSGAAEDPPDCPCGIGMGDDPGGLCSLCHHFGSAR